MNMMQFFDGLTTYNSLFILSALGIAYLLGIFSMQGYMMALRKKLRNRKKTIEQLNKDLKVVRAEYLDAFQDSNTDLLANEDMDQRAKFLHLEFNNFKEDFQDSIEFYVHSIDELSESNHKLLKKVKALQLENEHLIKTVWSDENSFQSFSNDVQKKPISSNDIQLVESAPIAEKEIPIENNTSKPKSLKHWLETYPNHIQKDKLSEIKGISIALEARINKIGILGFYQLSQLDDSLIDDLAKAINYYAGRIRKEDWMGQAALLAEK